jgi:nucleotide-binding universal stress UspA family protein
VINILHPTDFSDNACKALKYAYDLSKKLNANLRILHISEVPSIVKHPHAFSFEEMDEQEKASAMSRLKDCCTKILGNEWTLSNISLDVRIDKSITNGILNAIKENNTNLLVIGARGQSKFKEVVMGSTTRKLIAKSTCPMLTIPENARMDDIKQVVYTSDFDQHDMAVLQKLATLTAKFDATIKILHVFSSELNHRAEADNFKKQLKENISYPSLEYVSLVSENVSEAILNYLEEFKPDLLVMFEKEKSGLIGRMFHSDLVKHFAIHTLIPLLSFNTHSVTSDLL